jgi:hypothetical protein
MKYLLFSILTIICFPAYSQQLDTATCFVEIDTIYEPIYRLSNGDWKQKGFNISREEIRDSIGIRGVKIMKMYYIFDRKRMYIPYIFREIVSGTSDIDSRTWH